MPTQKQLHDIARRFGAGGCCGKKPKVTSKDLATLGLIAIPVVFDSSLGRIAPYTGWKALCIYVYETIADQPVPVAELTAGGKDRDVGELVAEMLSRRAASFDHDGRYVPRQGDIVRYDSRPAMVIAFMETPAGDFLMDLAFVDLAKPDGSREHVHTKSTSVVFLRPRGKDFE